MYVLHGTSSATQNTSSRFSSTLAILRSSKRTSGNQPFYQFLSGALNFSKAKKEKKYSMVPLSKRTSSGS